MNTITYPDIQTKKSRYLDPDSVLTDLIFYYMNLDQDLPIFKFS